MRLCPLLDSNQRSNFVRFNPINSMPESTVETACSYCRAAGCGRRNPDLFQKKKKANITELSTRAIPPANPSYASTLHSFARRRSSPRRSRAQPIPRRITRKPQQEKKKVRSPRRGSPRRNRRDVQQPAETHAAQRGRRRQNSKHAPPPHPGRERKRTACARRR